MTDKTKNPASEMFDQALQNYEQALRTGLQVQEEAGRCWTKLLNQAASPHDWQKQLTSLANDVIPPTQKTMEGYLNLLEQNSRASVELLKKGIEAAQTKGFAEGQGKLVEFCEGSLKSLKANAQAIVDLNGKAIDSWVSVVKKTTANVVELKAGKA
jgi:translation initiation factor 2 alpha subunit (eIF-2alpha)